MKYLLVIVSILCGFSVVGQIPTPVSIDKVSAGATGLVSIQGTGFGGDPNDLVVYFGGSRGTIQTASDQLIEVNAPPGATYDNISVTNIINGLTGYTRHHFLLSFGNDFGFDPNDLVGQTDFPVGTGLFDLCMCDFNDDGRTDVATSNDPVGAATTISILTNTSPGPGTVSFSTSTVSIAAKSLHIRCGDLNGDGKPDLIVSEGGVGARLFILQNNSSGTVSFLAPQIITIPGAKTKNIQIADLDRDGKPELVVTDQGENKVTILVNQSAGSISFSPTQLQLTAAGAVSSDGLVVDDFNGDDRPDIITSQYLTSVSNLFVFRNSSTPGNVAFENSIPININGSVIALKAGDLDGDRKPELAVTQLLSNSVSVLANTSSATSISFGPAKAFSTDDRPWGMDFGDVDGDGRADIVVASIFKKSLTILNNISSAGNLDFQRHIKATTFINRHINIGDVDTDGKPDILFTSIDDNNNGIPASQMSVFRNKTCIIPKVTPEGPITVCAGFPLQLFSTVSRGVNYDWKLNGVTQVSGTNPFILVTSSGTYTVTATAEGGSCSEISNAVIVNVGTGTATGLAVPFNDGPACATNTLTLGVNSVGGATQYLWTGPNGYTGNGLAPTPITNFQLVNAGRYFVDVMVGTCLAQRTSTLVEIIDIPDFTVVSSSGNVICQGDNNVLTISPPATGFSYQWVKDGANIGGATSNTFTATASGVYSVKAKYTSGGCQEVETNKLTLTAVTKPVPAFTAPATACANQKVKFTNQSTTDGAVAAVYHWKFDGSNTSSEKDPEHIFTTASTVNVVLTVSYADNACAQVIDHDIIITPATPISVTNPQNKYNFCEGDSLELEVIGAFTSYLWSTSETTQSIFVKEEGIFSVDVEATNGCILTAQREVITDPAPAVLVTATPEQITEGGSSQLEASGLGNYAWTPPDGLSSTTIFNPVATPLVTTTYTVKGTAVGFTCPGIATIQVEVKGEPIVNKLTPSKFFSPNQDDKNPVWLVDKITDFPQCGVSIYDDKGVKVFEAKPYLNDWDGTFNGQKLPDGVYYYVIRCDGEESKPRTGSITVLR